MNMIQRQLGLVPSIVRKEDKGEYIQSLVDGRENDDAAIAQDVMLRHHIANLQMVVSPNVAISITMDSTKAISQKIE